MVEPKRKENKERTTKQEQKKENSLPLLMLVDRG